MLRNGDILIGKDSHNLLRTVSGGRLIFESGRESSITIDEAEQLIEMGLMSVLPYKFEKYKKLIQDAPN